MKLAEAAAEFLAHKRIAVAGVSGTKPDAANYVYQRLREAGYKVYAVNPNADEVEGDHCHHSLAAIGETVDGVVIATHPKVAIDVARECAELGIPRVWLHRSFGAGSYSAEAVAFCEAHGIAVIDGACPRMFLDPVDVPHRCIRFIFGALGKLPDGSRYEVAAQR
ncbi:MAG TPA: CoA-binding protein [Longimicrobiales bacterium]